MGYVHYVRATCIMEKPPQVTNKKNQKIKSHCPLLKNRMARIHIGLFIIQISLHELANDYWARLQNTMCMTRVMRLSRHLVELWSCLCGSLSANEPCEIGVHSRNMMSMIRATRLMQHPIEL